MLAGSSLDADWLGVAPCLDLAIAPGPLPRAASILEPGQHVVVIVSWDKLQAQVVAGRPKEAEQRAQRGLPSVVLVRRDHGGWYAGAVRELTLAQARLESGQLE